MASVSLKKERLIIYRKTVCHLLSANDKDPAEGGHCIYFSVPVELNVLVLVCFLFNQIEEQDGVRMYVALLFCSFVSFLANF